MFSGEENRGKEVTYGTSEKLVRNKPKKLRNSYIETRLLVSLRYFAGTLARASTLIDS